MNACFHRHAPAASSPGKILGTHCTGGGGGLQGRSGRVGKALLPQDFEPWTVKSVASRYTGYAIQAAVSHLA